MDNQRGSAALFGLMMMMLLLSIGATLLELCQTELQIAGNHRDGTAAQYLAEAGVQDAVAKLQIDHQFVSQTETKNYTTTSQSLAPRPIAGSYTAQTGPDPQFVANTNKRLIIATGMVNQAHRQVVAHITLSAITGEGYAVMVIWNN